MRFIFFILPIFFLVSCGGVRTGDYKQYLSKKEIWEPVPERIPHCHGYGCAHLSSATLSDADWVDISALIEKSENAEQERGNLGQTIALFEKKMGVLTGTEVDRGGTYVRLGRFQHDCVDESINTTIYLSLLQQKELLRFHDIGMPSSRVPLLGGGLGAHQTAVIIDQTSGEAYAVDSWFHDNGEAAEIVSFDDWFFGWRPD